MSGDDARLFLWLSAAGPVLAETLARDCAAAADGVIIDHQHGAYGMDAALAVLAAVIGKAKHVVVRISEVGDAETCKFLDAGATTVIAPMINTPEQCERFVHSCLYPPQGVRSFGPYRQKALIKGGFSLQAANAQCVPLAMIETKQALANLDAILAVPGLGGVFVGPNDLAISMGYAPSSSPQGAVLEAVALIAKRTRARRLVAGIFCTDAATCRAMQKLGFNFVSVGTDAVRFFLAF